MTAFHPFETAENALENINAITEHEMTEDLRTFLESNLSKGKKASKYPLGVVSSILYSPSTLLSSSQSLGHHEY